VGTNLLEEYITSTINLHSITTQQTTIHIFTAMKTSNFIQNAVFCSTYTTLYSLHKINARKTQHEILNWTQLAQYRNIWHKPVSETSHKSFGFLNCLHQVNTDRFISLFANLLPLGCRERYQPVFTSSQTGKLPLKKVFVKLRIILSQVSALERSHRIRMAPRMK
jgi:hypothetical protein